MILLVNYSAEIQLKILRNSLSTPHGFTVESTIFDTISDLI